MEIEEIWKDIPGFENYYQVNNRGIVRSIRLKIKILKPQPTKGYFLVTLYKEKQKKTRTSIHRIVAEVFIPNPENKPQVNHKNGIKTDNRVENLEWCTTSENVKHAFEILGRVSLKGEKHGASKLNENQAIEILNSNKPQSELAKKYSVCLQNIVSIQKRRSWKHILIALFLLSVTFKAHSQTYIMPAWIADSLIFETRQSRQCMITLRANLEEIKALGVELVHTNAALSLSKSESLILDSLVSNSKRNHELLTMQFQKDLSEQKRKTKRWRKVAVIQTLGIVVLIILTL